MTTEYKNLLFDMTSALILTAIRSKNRCKCRLSCQNKIVTKNLQVFYTLLFHLFFKVEFDIDHFVLGEHREC